MFRAIVLSLLLIQAPPLAHQQQTPSQNKNDNTKASPIDTHLQNEQGSPKGQSKWWQPPPLWDIYWPTLGLLIATGIAVWTAVRTLRDMDAQIVEMRATGQQTDRLIAENIAQSAAMAQSVKETGRFAAAMESVGKSLEITAKISAETAKGLRQQMRAYINVSVGGAVYQERNKHVKFQANPVITNNGLTPAHDVRQKVKAAILPVPLPPNFDYPLPADDSGETMVGPRQQTVVSPIVDDFVADAEIDDIKIGKGKALCVWGLIEYKDVFGDPHRTRFAQILTWLQDGNIWGYYLPGHNDGT